jgi:hypothetical protein
MVDTHAFKDQ